MYKLKIVDADGAEQTFAVQAKSDIALLIYKVVNDTDEGVLTAAIEIKKDDPDGGE